MKKYFLFAASILFFSVFSYAQTPREPLINGAKQEFLENGLFQSTRTLSVSQFLSPRVMRPGHNNPPEKIIVMFVGDWLDFTNEVVVTGPNSNATSGVRFKNILVKTNGPCNTFYTSPSSPFPNYNGVQLVVEFEITSEAALGTHTVKLIRPGTAGLGRVEARPFYLEVMEEERIYDIKFKKEGENIFRNSASVNERGTVLITGQELGSIRLDRNINRMNENGFFSNISDATVNDNQIRFKATLVKAGMLGYDKLMPANLQHAEYPRGVGGELQITPPPGPPVCNLFRNQLSLTVVNGGAPLSPNLEVSFFGDTLISRLDNLSAKDIAKYSLCQPSSPLNVDRQVTIGKLFVRVANTGNGASGESRLYLCTVTNSNFDVPPSITIPAMGVGATPFEFEIKRKQNKISVITNSNGSCVRSPDNTNNIKRWNDIGIVASIYTSVHNGLKASNAEIR